MTQHAFFLESRGTRIAATCWIPVTGVRAALLIIPPLCEERKGVLPICVQMARTLAEEQIASLFFDCSGCGDATGSFADTTPEQLETDCECALTWLAHAFPGALLVLLGLRTGAVLATRLAVRRTEVDLLVAWSPISGKHFVRHLLQRRLINEMIAYGQARVSRNELEHTLQTGGRIDLDGYTLTGACHEWLQHLIPEAVTQPVLLIAGGHDPATCDALATCCPDTTRIVTRYPPFWDTVGQVAVPVLIDDTRAWLSRQIARLPSTTTSGPHDALPVAVSDAAELVTLGEEARHLAAIFDTPQETPRSGVLFLHGWSGDRTGPHRLFTRFARELAAAGVLALRFDFFGRGLSAGHAEEASIAGMAKDAELALQALKRRLPAGAPIALAAICSGCKVAITLAAAHPEIDRLVLWSPESMGSLRSASTGWRKTVNALRSYGRKLTRPDTWRKVLSGRVHTRLVAKALVNHETRSASEAAAEDQTLRAFRAFCHPLLMVFGGSDPDAPGSRRAYEHFCRRHGIPCEIHTIPHAGHSYYSEPWTETLFRISHPFLAP